MKCLTLREPYASLIKNNIKHIETRSWNTSYRGKIYIHTSISKVPKDLKKNKDFEKLISGLDYHYGEIVCECNLIDVKLMSKEFIDDLKKNNYQEYLCGDYKVGRYAWLLDNVKVLEKPIKAKGQLGIWNYYNEQDIMNILNDINYGWLDFYGQTHFDDYELFSENYLLQSPKEVLKNKIGVCWDQVELERWLFAKTNLEFKTYFIIYNDGKSCPTHTFLVFKKEDKYWWFEHSWFCYRGIHKYNTLEELLKDVKNKFMKKELKGKFNKNNLYLYEYSKPNYHLNVQEFCAWAENGNEIK